MKETIIRPQSGLSVLNLHEIWHHRELLYIFTWRDVKIRYKQTIFGVLWVVFQPLASTGVFTIFFGKLGNIQSGDLPYSLFVFTGLVLWFFFSNSLSRMSEIMVAEQNLIKKVYFPKIILPLSALITNLFDFSINCVVLLLAASIFGYPPKIWILFTLPLALLITGITSLGIGFILSSLNVKYRDVRYILPFFIQLLLFVTPVIYPLSIVGESNRYFLAFNPLTTAVELFRSSFMKQAIIQSEFVILSIVSCILIFCIGLWYFVRTEKFFADIV